MRLHYTATLCLLLGCRLAAAQQPFARLGITVPVLTLSNGRYPEYFANDSLRRIGSVVYNCRLHRIAYLLPTDSLTGHAPAEATSRWLSTDPLAAKYAHLSPYNFVDNSPINNTDPDGQDIDYKTTTSINAKTGKVVITVTANVTVKVLGSRENVRLGC